MPPRLTVKVDRLNIVIGDIRKIAANRVLVGIPSEKTARRGEKGFDEQGLINNAALGFIHENGSAAQNIPERPFLIPGVRGIQDDIAKRFEAFAKARLAGDAAGAEKQLHIIGLMGQNAVRAKITDGPFTALSERTLAARRARGRTGTKPLIDTGQLRNSVSYVVTGISVNATA